MDAVSDTDGLCFPYDVLLDILRRLPCSTIAQSRTICRVWRAIVDDHGLLPLFFSSPSFPGVFTNHAGCRDRSYFLAAPASGTRAGAFRRPLFCHGWARVEDYCNGLLLLRNHMISGRKESNTYVCNPTTVRCDALPRAPSMWGDAGEGTFLAFDPAVSLHYKVYKVYRDYQIYSKTPGSEEPEEIVVYSWVYSSQTRRWKL
ncbi:hypothetical protein QYE76_071788 [Lolium multiflorum]|uniref:F-box domain-containing protein n=1 Tax=Lolium multiflorum TaxID=4521 RepID=A0AAD8SM55_LOLMU|nr:hypothetical protein QYE76_071788 [Lolium multiflorum]